MKKVACIEIASNRKGGKLQDLSDVRSVNDLMLKKAMPIRNITFRYAKDVKHGAVKGGTIGIRDEIFSGHRDETLGEALERIRRTRKEEKKAAYRRTLSGKSSSKKGLGNQKTQDSSNSNSSQDSSVNDISVPKRRFTEPLLGLGSISSLSDGSSELSFDLDEAEIVHIPDNIDTIQEQGKETTAQDETQEDEAKTDQLDFEDDFEDDFDTNSRVLSEVAEEGEQEEDTSTVTSQLGSLPGPQSDVTVRRESSDVTKLDLARFSSNSISKSTERTVLSEFSLAEGNRTKKSSFRPKSCMKVKTLEESLKTASHILEDNPSLDFAPALPSRRESTSSIGSKFSGMNSLNSLYKASENSNSSFCQSLQWGQVELREYSICLGDNPACANGPPIQLDWDYETTLTSFVVLYDQKRQSKPRTLRRLSSSCRQRILLENGHTPEEMERATRDKIRDQKQRVRTVSRLKYMEFDAKIERIVRIFPQS